jgi:D-arabinose 1-dehydrogenase-like Zn-dependent alcohol dehydrogenase
MRAFRVLGRGQVELQDLPDPEPGPGEVRIRVVANGICHSDVHSVENADAVPFLTSTAYSLDQVTTAWEDLLAGRVLGRAVVVP